MADDFKWFNISDYYPKTPHDLDSFESEGQWLSGTHPIRPSTSWLEEDADDEHEEFDDEMAEKELYDLMDVSQGYRGAALVCLPPSSRFGN